MKLGPIRVAQIMGKLVGRGVESVIFNYYRHIDHTKIQFDFYADDDSTVPMPQDILDAGARCYMIPRYQRLPQNMAALYRHFKEQGYTIVHSDLNALSVFSLCAARLAGVPVRIAHSHSTAGKGDTKKNILKYILRPFAKTFATNYVACSRYAGAWLFGKKAMEQGKVTIFNNAIELDAFRYDRAVRGEVRTELGLEGKFVIGHVGAFCYQKNHEFLLDIFRDICGQCPDAVLLLVGDGPDRARIEEKARGMAVLSLGQRDDVGRLYQAMDVFVLPSRYEGLPVVGVEAQAAGLPCLLSDAVTQDAKVTDGAVFLSISNGTGPWVQKLLELRDFDRTDTSEQLAKQGFSIADQGAGLLRYYAELLRGQGISL